MGDLAIIALGGAVGFALAHLLVRYLIQKAVPELADMPREARDWIASNLDTIQLPAQMAVLRVLLLYGSLIAIFMIGTILDAPAWAMGLTYAVAIPLLMAIRFWIARSFVAAKLHGQLQNLREQENEHCESGLP